MLPNLKTIIDKFPSQFCTLHIIASSKYSGGKLEGHKCVVKLILLLPKSDQSIHRCVGWYP